MKELLSLRSKLQGYKILPQTEYRAIGEHLLPEVQLVIDKLEEYKETIKKQGQEDHLKTIVGMAESGRFVVLEFDGFQYSFNVLKEKINK